MQRLTIDPESHGYRLDGLPIASVTAILKAAGLGGEYNAVPVEILEAAKVRGRTVHRFCEQWDADHSTPIPEAYAPYALAYCRFRTQTQFEQIEAEQPVYHPTLHYAGTPDWVGFVNGERAIVDIKTTSVMDHVITAVQTAGYRGARTALLPAEPVERIYGLHLRDTGDYRFVEYDAEDAWQTFCAALTIFRFRRRHKKGKS